MIAVTSTESGLLATLEIQPLTIKNAGPVTVYLGTASTVTADTSVTGGYPLNPGESVNIEAKTTSPGEVDYYGVTAAGTAYIAVLIRG